MNTYSVTPIFSRHLVTDYTNNKWGRVSLMETCNFSSVTFSDFKWLNEPPLWKVAGGTLEIKTKLSDFWRKTHYNFCFNTGHVYGVEIKDDFSFEICVEADFETLYDQAGLMIYLDEKHWLKAGIEYNDDQPMISCVLTNGVSDWSTGVFTGDPDKFWLRLTKLKDVICVKYSADNVSWTLLRLCPCPAGDRYLVGPMTCSPKRDGLLARFSGLSITSPAKDILHSN